MQKNYKRILFIFPYPLGVAPSQRFRFEQYFNLLIKMGYTIEVKPFITLSTWKILYGPGKSIRKVLGVLKGFFNRLTLLFGLYKFDFIFIHREATPLGPPWFEWIAKKVLRKKIVYDFDDSIWIPNTSSENKIVTLFKWHSKVKAICRWSHKVSCGNAYLSSFAKQYNNSVVLNPTTIDTYTLHNPLLFEPSTISDKITIGWTGTHSTLKYLNPLLPVFQSLKDKYKERIQFLVIADKPPSISIPGLIFKKWNIETEIEDLIKVDIGIMPLTDDEWAKGKCGFKALQYMALEIPAVVSPVGVNSDIIENGITGYLAKSTADWYLYLEKLIKDKDLRKKIGTRGRKKIIEVYSVDANASNFISLFELSRRKSNPTK